MRLDKHCYYDSFPPNQLVKSHLWLFMQQRTIKVQIINNNRVNRFTSSLRTLFFTLFAEMFMFISAPCTRSKYRLVFGFWLLHDHHRAVSMMSTIVTHTSQNRPANYKCHCQLSSIYSRIMRFSNEVFASTCSIQFSILMDSPVSENYLLQHNHLSL